ncbi:hypothetical protein ACXR2U_13995 [Jatrophihabitans sp. YIM 134969]
MSTDRSEPTSDDRSEGDTPTGGASATEALAAAGDDERESRENIDRTGEPDRDDLGNGDGAS